MSNYYIVIPAFNEQRYIETVLRKTCQYTDSIVVVDDGSVDDTFALSCKYTKHVLKHEINLGKGAAMKTGIEYAFSQLDAEAVIFMDGDGQHDPKNIPEFIRKLNQGNNLVFGVRSLHMNMPGIRVFTNTTGTRLIHWLFGTHIPDPICGFKAITKMVYPKICWNTYDYSVEMEIVARTAKHKLPFATVPIETIYLDLNRGMTAKDTIKILFKMAEWKLTL